MKNFTQTILCILVFSVCITQTNSIQAQTLIIDNFDKEPINVGKKYSDYIGNKKGYDIYYRNTVVKLSHIQVSADDTTNKALRINFSLPPEYSWGNWLSIRNEFQSAMDLEDYNCLMLNLKVEVPATDAFLRITLTDLTDDEKDGDEMWWFDSDRSILDYKTQKWIEIYIPFNYFYISRGAGTRHNDYKFNLQKIASYEINLVSDAGTYPKGIILLDSLRAYREQLVFFGFDKSVIESEYYSILDCYVRFLKKNSNVKLEIHGHTDNIGTMEYNQLLSERRAKEAMFYLQNNGIAKKRISIVGHSYLMPIASNKTKDGRAENRRIQLKLIY